MNDIPQTERAVQLVGPDKLELNSAKPVADPGPHQVLARVEAVGLCFSDLKLLKQFSQHSRKSDVLKGLGEQALAEMPNYVPGDKPTVPGHEAVIRVVKVGQGVGRYKTGERFIVETDYRWLPTDKSNAAFGYNFEGGLQEYVLLDERVITSPDGESMLIPAPEDLSASALALVEPWACVENAYTEIQRRTLKPGGRLLVVGDAPVDRAAVDKCPGRAGSVVFATGDSVAAQPDAGFDDIVYFGADAATAETLFAKLAAGGLLAIVQGGRKFGRPVETQVGRVHYGGIRVVGTAGADPGAAYSAIPASPEIRPGDKINIVGAAGPMGTMHVIRDLCQGAEGVTVYAGDLNDDRLAGLGALASPLAERNGVTLRPYNPSKNPPGVAFDYVVLMAPVDVDSVIVSRVQVWHKVNAATQAAAADIEHGVLRLEPVLLHECPLERADPVPPAADDETMPPLADRLGHHARIVVVAVHHGCPPVRMRPCISQDCRVSEPEDRSRARPARKERA